MLILSRKPNQSLIIGDDNVSVDREEIRIRKDRGQPAPSKTDRNQ